MPTPEIGRQGILGLAIEASAGVAESTPDIFLPFTENSLMSMHEPIADLQAIGSRIQRRDSIAGKKWMEGDTGHNLELWEVGYLLKLVNGNEIKTQLSADPAVADHLFYPTVSGNQSKTATLWNYDSQEWKQYKGCALDSLEFNVSDGLAQITASWKGIQNDTDTPTQTTRSGLVMSYINTTLQFGDDLDEAENASATPAIQLNFQHNNNLEGLYQTGNSAPTEFAMGELTVKGSYKLFFDSATERDKYLNLTKKAMIIKCTGAGIGAGYTEHLKLRLQQVTIQNQEIDTGLEGFYAIQSNYEAEIRGDRSPEFMDVQLRNAKDSLYA